MSKPSFFKRRENFNNTKNNTNTLAGFVRHLHPLNDVRIEKLGDIDWNDSYNKQNRAGVILFYREGGNLFFGLAVDSKFHSLTDFGGGKTNTDLTPIDTAIRELCEETLGLIKVTKDYDFESVKTSTKSGLILKYSDFLKSWTIRCSESLIIFLEISGNLEFLIKEFNDEFDKNSDDSENSAITIVNETELRRYLSPISRKKVYLCVRRLLNSKLEEILNQLKR